MYFYIFRTSFFFFHFKLSLNFFITNVYWKYKTHHWKMFFSQVELSWREQEWDHWFRIFKWFIIVKLDQIFQIYNQDFHQTNVLENRSKNEHITKIMRVLNKHTFHLIDEWISKIIIDFLIVQFVFVSISVSIDVFYESNLINIERVLRLYLKKKFHKIWQLKAEANNSINMIKFCFIEIVESQIELRRLWSHQVNEDISHLRLRLVSNIASMYEFFKIDSLYFYRDRDSSWRNNSCAVDCCVMTTRLLNLKFIIQDKKDFIINEWRKSFFLLQRSFLRFIIRSWKKSFNDECFRIRNDFYVILLQSLNISNKRLRKNNFLFVVELWNLCTSDMHQFFFSKTRYFDCSKCNVRLFTHAQNSVNQHFVQIDESNENARTKLNSSSNMTRLINHYFESQERLCRTCQTRTKTYYRIIHENLFSRFVVYSSMINRNAFIDVIFHRMSIRYKISKNQIKKTLYRWLKNIFVNQNHFRFYWSNYKHFIKNVEKFLLYDDKMLENAIMNDVNSINIEHKVSRRWRKNINILFYEQIKSKNKLNFTRLSKSIVQKITSIVNDILLKISSKNIDIINLENDDQNSNSESSASAKKTSKFNNSKNIKSNNDMFSFFFFFFLNDKEINE